MCIERTPWEQVVDFHGHTCPEIALGYRVAQIALREMGIRPTPAAELTIQAGIRSCALDAFQILNHVTYGRGNLNVDEQQRHVYHFQYTGTPKKLQISVNQEIIEHLTVADRDLTPREKQTKSLEAIQYILSTDETLFCSLQEL